MLGSLVGAVAKGVGDVMAKDAAKGLRQAIAGGRVERSVGPLHMNEGMAAIGRVRETIEGAQIELLGTCTTFSAGCAALISAAASAAERPTRCGQLSGSWAIASATSPTTRSSSRKKRISVGV